MSEHRYTAASVRGDLLRAVLGATACGAPLLIVDTGAWIGPLLGLAALLFMVFGLRSFLRLSDTVVVNSDGIRLNNGRRHKLAWNSIAGFKLSYFSTRRDHENGWMQLKLVGPGARISIDSNLDGFETICRRAYQAARENGVELGAATLRNAASLGLPVETLTKDPDSDRDTRWGNPADWRR